MCKYQATVVREFDENVIRVECTTHSNVVMDTVVPDAELNQFLAAGKDLSEIGLLPTTLVHAVASALRDAGHDVAQFLGN